MFSLPRSPRLLSLLFGEPGAGSRGAAPVTVTSAPTPYSALSTPDWALFTPAEAAATVTTSPTPRARPSAMKMAWRIRRRSSRRRYVTKNIECSYRRWKNPRLRGPGAREAGQCLRDPRPPVRRPASSGSPGSPRLQRPAGLLRRPVPGRVRVDDGATELEGFGRAGGPGTGHGGGDVHTVRAHALRPGQLLVLGRRRSHGR